MSKNNTYKLTAIEMYEEVLLGDTRRIFPSGFWKRKESLNDAKDILLYVIEEKLKLSDDEIKKQFGLKFMVANRLGGMLAILFDNSPYKAINTIYPDLFKVWEFGNVPINYWNLNTAKDATIWLIEKKLKLLDSELKQLLSLRLFKVNGLSGMMQVLFNDSPFMGLDNAYKGKYVLSDFKQCNYYKK